MKYRALTSDKEASQKIVKPIPKRKPLRIMRYLDTSIYRVDKNKFDKLVVFRN